MNEYKYKRFRMETINPSVSIINLWSYTFTTIIILFFVLVFVRIKYGNDISMMNLAGSGQLSALFLIFPPSQTQSDFT